MAAAAGVVLTAHLPLQLRPRGPVYEYTLSWWELTPGPGAVWRHCSRQLTAEQLQSVTGGVDLMRRFVACGRQNMVIQGAGPTVEPRT